MLALESAAVFHVGPDLPMKVTQWPGSYGPVEALEGTKLILGFFRDRQDNDWLMVVSRCNGLPTIFETPLGPGEWDEWPYDLLKKGETLGQVFEAKAPFDAISIMLHRDKRPHAEGPGAKLRLRSSGPNGKVVAQGSFVTHNQNTGVHFQFEEQPPGTYALEMHDNDQNDLIGWRTRSGSNIGGALHNGNPVSEKHRRIWVQSRREPVAQPVRVHLRSVAGAWEVSPRTGQFLHTPLIPQGGEAIVLETELRAGEGRLFRLVK